MALQDFNNSENSLSSLRGGAGWSGLGRYASVADNDAVGSDSGGEYVSYVDVTPHPNAPNANALEVPPPRTMSAGTALQLPQFDFATGVSSCTSCTPEETAAKVAAANAAAVVTPMPDAPKGINWLLIAGALGLGYYFLKSGPSGSGMGNPATEPNPAPIVQDLGRPASKPKTKPKHVAHLEI